MVTGFSIERCLTGRTRLILPVHFAGAPADMKEIERIAAAAGIPVAEDAAHAFGSEYRGKRVGGRNTSIFSFHPIKNITTGEGGMFCSNDEGLLDRIRRLKFHGLGQDAYDRHTQGRAPKAEVLEPGYKYNMTDISAVLGLGQMERIDAFIAKRTELTAIHAEVEGIARRSLFEQFLRTSLSRGISFVSLGEFLSKEEEIGTALIKKGTVKGREGWVSCQSALEIRHG